MNDQPVTIGTKAERELSVAISRCTEFDRAGSDSSHKCHQIVNCQRHLSEKQLPEPWFGNLSGAQVLFVSSNPSIDDSTGLDAEWFPLSGWSDEEIAEWVVRRVDQSWQLVPVTFGRTDIPDFWRRDAERVAYRGYGKGFRQPQRTWNNTHRRAMEILGSSADPGKNYAITEVVHCKSKNEIGVAAAASRCTDMWMEKVAGVAASARVVLLCGSKVRNNWARQRFALSPDFGRQGNKTLPQMEYAKRDIFVGRLGGIPRLFVSMGQPAFSKTLTNLYGERVLNLIGAVAQGAHDVPNSTYEWIELVQIGREYA